MYVCISYFHVAASMASLSFQEPHLPLAGLDSYCRGSSLYSPFFDDLPSQSVSSSLTHPNMLSLLPATALCEPTLLKGIPLQNTDLPVVDEQSLARDHNLDRLMTGEVDWKLEPKVVFLAGDEEDVKDNDLWKVVEKNWKLLVISLSLSVCQLQKTPLKTQSQLVCVCAHMSVCLWECACASVWVCVVSLKLKSFIAGIPSLLHPALYSGEKLGYWH